MSRKLRKSCVFGYGLRRRNKACLKKPITIANYWEVVLLMNRKIVIIVLVIILISGYSKKPTLTWSQRDISCN